MGFRNNAIATIWKVKESNGENRFRDVQISTSRKNRKTGEYESDFSGFVRFVGNAMTGVEALKEKDRIVLKNVDVSRKYDKEKKKEFVHFIVFDWEPYSNKTNSQKNQSDQDNQSETMSVNGNPELNIAHESEEDDEDGPPFM